MNLSFDIPDKLKKLLEIPLVYNCFQHSTGYYKFMIQKVSESIQAINPTSIVDLGCGPGMLLQKRIVNNNYLGIDISPKYTTQAEMNARNLSIRSLFETKEVEKVDYDKYSDFLGGGPIFLALGLFHHLSNENLKLLLKQIKKTQSNAQILSIDPVFIDDQDFVSKYIVSQDRGKFVRHKNDLIEILLEDSFRPKKLEVGKGFTRLPSDLMCALWELY
jgi:SAM-dependent methyltransferase